MSALSIALHPTLYVVAYVIASLLGWFALLVLGYGLSGGQLGRGKWWVFQCFWEDLLRNIPGGLRRKVARIKADVGTPDQNRSGVFAGQKRSWTYEELRDTGEYEECAKAMFGTPAEFWLGTVVVSFLFGPFFLIILIAGFFVETTVICLQKLKIIPSD